MTTSQEYFLSVAKTLNMTQSAKELFVSQQSLSYHISQLEKQYRTPLFIRKPVLRLTQAGERLRCSLEKLAKMERDIFEEIQDCSFPASGTLIVGMHSSRFNLIAPLVCSEFQRQAPGSYLKVLPGKTTEFEQQLLRGELDAFIGVNPHQYPNVEIYELLHETAYVVMLRWMWEAKRGTKAKETFEQEEICLEDVLDLPFVDCLSGSSQLQAYLDNYVQSKGLRWNRALTCTDPFAYVVMEDHLRMATIFPRGHTLRLPRINQNRPKEGQLLAFPLKNMEWNDRLCVVHSQDCYISKSLSCFLKIVRQAFQNI